MPSLETLKPLHPSNRSWDLEDAASGVKGFNFVGSGLEVYERVIYGGYIKSCKDFMGNKHALRDGPLLGSCLQRSKF